MLAILAGARWLCHITIEDGPSLACSLDGGILSETALRLSRSTVILLWRLLYVSGTMKAGDTARSIEWWLWRPFLMLYQAFHRSCGGAVHITAAENPGE